MSAGITVEDFKYVRGVNDSEYIELLKNAYERQRYIASKAIAKLKEQPVIIRCKDCRWNDGTCYCKFHYRDVKADNYCSWAERRTDEQR